MFEPRRCLCGCFASRDVLTESSVRTATAVGIPPPPLPKQHALEQLQSAIKPFLKGFVKEKASEQSQSTIYPFEREFVREGASEQYSTAK